ncbi:MAG: YihY/virulence factor BrkB family protein [Planctomycetes bacterium]|nr:YihY/virulence factor BrkB family protein [Planctomycetota bacterium]MCP4770096.1 YihY/virulence factor BrkB family protein [Planctomycetota bacterium]MCP4860756.1 YihY/virulence factor BrkB family protein [Planctomycetota bacterium]
MPNSGSSDGKDHGMDHVVGPVRRLVQIGKRIIQELTHDDLSGVAAQMTYYFMLALFPALILLVGLLDALPLEKNVSGIVSSLFSGLPEDVASMLSRYVNEFATRRPPGSLVLWILASLWATSRGIRGARKGLNRVFRCKPTKNMVLIRLQDVVLTIAGLLFMGLAYLLLIGGKQLGVMVVNLVGLDLSIQVLWVWLRLPVTLLLMTCFVVLVYRFLPSRRVGLRPLLAGALPTVVAWMLLGSVFRFWLRHLGNFDEIYGGLTSFFLLMFLLWLVSLVLLLGGEVTARLDDRMAGRPETELPPDPEEETAE